jgi:hypothetical protein
MKILVSIILLLLLPALSFAASQSVAHCGVANANSDVYVGMRYTSSVNVLMATNMSSVSLPETGLSSYALLSIKGKTNSSGDVLLTLSSGTMLVLSCVPYASEFSFNLLMGFAGALCAGMLFYSILSAFLN